MTKSMRELHLDTQPALEVPLGRNRGVSLIVMPTKALSDTVTSQSISKPTTPVSASVTTVAPFIMDEIVTRINYSTGSSAYQSATHRCYQMEPIQLADVKKDKSYVKLVKKLAKERDDLQKKHQKQRELIQKQQQSSVDKLVTSTNKQLHSTASGKQKKTAGAAAGKRGDGSESGSNNNNGGGQHSSLSSMRSDPAAASPSHSSPSGQARTARGQSEACIHDEKIRSLVLDQTDEWSGMRRRHMVEEFEMRHQHMRDENETTRRLLVEVQRAQLVTLRQRFDAENKELKQAQTKKSMDDTKALQLDKNVKSKAELDRRVKELNEKNVKVFVEERKRLAMKCRRYEEQLEKRHSEQLDTLERDFQRAIEQEESDHREQLLAARPGSVV